MLSPSYLLHATEPAEEIAEKLHQDILQRIIERILRRIERGDGYILTAQDKWQLETIQEAGFLLDEVQKEVTAAIPPMQTEIAQAMEDAGVVAMEYDDAIYQAAGLHPVGLTQSPHLIRILQRTFEVTAGEWANVTRTTADAAQTAYIQACDRAYYMASSNAMTASQAVKEALNDIITEGVVVKYPSGHTDTLETATARAVRTGISQGAAQIQTARMDEMGVNLVIVSAHLGARPDHFKWQGKVYSRSGATDKYPDFVSSTGYGTVTGLCGANCRHSFSPYFEGQDNPYDQFDSKENQKAYEMQQRQRTMERRIRDTKRRLMGYEAAGDTERYQRTAALLQKQNAAYDAYCKENGLTKQTDRISIAKWNRSEAAKARVAAKRRIEEVGEGAAVLNWHTISVAGGQTDTKYRVLSELQTIDENVAATNPGYKKGEPAYRQNCQRCVPAYEMRRRGYDVIAKPAVVDKDGELSPKDPLYTAWRKVFEGAKFVFCSGYDKGKAEIINLMEEWGDGSVAEVRVLWKDNKAHVFVAERINGEVRFIDPQNGKECGNYFTDASLGGTMIARIDNLNPSALIELCIKNRGGK